jgi:hypothetical protein
MGAERKAHAKTEAAAARVTAPIAAWNQRQVRRIPLLLRGALAPRGLRQPDFISCESMPGSDIDLQRTTRRSFSLDDVGWRFARVPTNDTYYLQDILEPSASWLSTQTCRYRLQRSRSAPCERMMTG